MSPKGVDEFVTVQEITYALSARIAELEALLDVSDDFTVAYIVGKKDGDDRAKAAEARIAELEAARDLGVIEGDVVAHMNVVSLHGELMAAKSRIEELTEPLLRHLPQK